MNVDQSKNLQVRTLTLGLSVAAAILYGVKVRQSPNWGRMIAKTAATTLLSVWAAISGGPNILTAALALGATGDAFLAWDGDVAFLGGLSSFLIAHIFYIVLFVKNNSGKDRILADGVRSGLAVGIMFLAPTMVAVLMPRIERTLRVPVFVYTTAILVMVLTALAMESDQLVVGGVLFAASDSILAADRFLVAATSSHRAWMQYAVWILYYSGQLLIAMGFLASVG